MKGKDEGKRLRKQKKGKEKRRKKKGLLFREPSWEREERMEYYNIVVW